MAGVGDLDFRRVVYKLGQHILAISGEIRRPGLERG
jgi:hypothetical protein